MAESQAVFNVAESRYKSEVLPIQGKPKEEEEVTLYLFLACLTTLSISKIMQCRMLIK